MINLLIYFIVGAGAGSGAWATPVSLLQETRAIECSFLKPHPKFDRLVIDAKDTKVEAFKEGKAAAEFTRTRFLDSAILLSAPNAADGGALLHILTNGDVQFSEGRLLKFLEQDCEDTGASKTCKAPGFKKLFWSPEKLTMDGQGGALRHYGFFANHATYFVAQDLTLLDYGRELHLLAGPARTLRCNYQEAEGNPR